MVFYFTFGSDERYPYGRNDFVEVIAPSEHLACELFQAFHPNRPGSDLINCAGIYSKETFDGFRDKHYPNRKPIEQIAVCRQLNPMAERLNVHREIEEANRKRLEDWKGGETR
jgi:hypothetical protein